MSGHANFAPIGHNLPPVQINVPGPAAPQVAPQPQPPAGIDQLAEVEPPVADGHLPTEALLRELDVMLAKAASASAEKGVDADALARTARAAKISADAAEKLQREGKVYDAAQWETREVQRSVAALGTKLGELPPVAGARPNAGYETEFLKEYNYTMAPTVFGRDILRGIRRKGWFE